MAPSATYSLDERLAKFREILKDGVDGSGPLDAFIVPTEDPHLSEHVPHCFDRRSYLSGFTGSAGVAAVTANKAALWTDGRYFLQASKQLPEAWTLQRSGEPGVPTLSEWLADVLPDGASVGIDGRVHTAAGADGLRTDLEAAGLRLAEASATNPVDLVWPEQPEAPAGALRAHPLEWAGRSASEKLAELREKLASKNASAIVLGKLDEVAWLLNLRGSDVPCTPVFLSFLLVSADSATLFVDPAKTTAVTAELEAAGVEVRPYDEVLAGVEAASEAAFRAQTRLWLDPSAISSAVRGAALDGLEKAGGPAAKRAKTVGRKGPGIVLEPSPVGLAKAVKNERELAGAVEAHLRDGAAFAVFASRLEKHVRGGGEVTEVELDEWITAARAEQEGFLYPSFDTIAGVDGNGAIIHYRADAATCDVLRAGRQLLLDSGGQYDCGTTDITRNFHFGSPSDAVRAAYTRVLQAHIALDAAVWAPGTPGCALDSLSRAPLWRAGLNYRHGTGHGVGAALDVHEGPQSISARYGNHQPLLASMVCSNEPGYYEDGGFGIRIENLFVVRQVPTDNVFGGLPYLGCDSITRVPFDRVMLDRDLLTAPEVAWFDAYHRKVWDDVSPRLADRPEALAWLRKETSPLE